MMRLCQNRCSLSDNGTNQPDAGRTGRCINVRGTSSGADACTSTLLPVWHKLYDIGRTLLDVVKRKTRKRDHASCSLYLAPYPLLCLCVSPRCPDCGCAVPVGYESHGWLVRDL